MGGGITKMFFIKIIMVRFTVIRFLSMGPVVCPSYQLTLADDMTLPIDRSNMLMKKTAVLLEVFHQMSAFTRN